MLTPDHQFWALVATLLAVIGAVATGLHRLLAWPFRWAFEAMFFSTVERCKARVRELWDGIYADRIVRSDTLASMTESLQREVAGARAVIDAQSRQLDVLPRVDKAVGELTTTLGALNSTLREVVTDVKTHGEDLAHMRGRMDEWDGVTERRQRPRAPRAR